MKSFSRRLGATLAAALVAGLGVTAATSASATVIDGDLTIDTTITQGNLHVYKYTAPPVEQNHGAPWTPGAENDPLENVPFEVVRITAVKNTVVDEYCTGAVGTECPVNLNTQEGWERAAKLAVKYNAATTASARTTVLAQNAVFSTLPAEKVGPKTTDSDGLALFPGLPIGLYLVTEGPLSGVTASAPFLVTIPMTNPTGDAWMTDIYVYPKGDQLKVGKTVVAPAPGSNIHVPFTYTISAEIPVLRVDNTGYGKFLVIDVLDPRLNLANIAADVEVRFSASSHAQAQTMVKGTDAAATNFLFTGTDYTVRIDTVYFDVDHYRAPAGTETPVMDRLIVELTGTLATCSVAWTDPTTNHNAANCAGTFTPTSGGLGKLEAAQAAGQEVQVVFQATANTIGADIPNGGSPDGGGTSTQLIVNLNRGDGPDSETDSEEEFVDFCGHVIQKTGSDTGGPLAGATFALFANEQAALDFARLPIADRLVYESSDIAGLFQNTTTGQWYTDQGLTTLASPQPTPRVPDGSIPFYTDPSATGKTAAGVSYAWGDAVYTVTTGADGIAIFSGLACSDSTTPATPYWIVELQAPTGYELLAVPVAINVNARSLPATIATGAQGVVNVPANTGFEIPIAGALGTTFLLVLAGLIAVVGTAALVASDRKKKSAAAA